MAAVREPKAGVPIIRVFRARARAGKERELADKLANTSPTVVKGKPAYLGYLRPRYRIVSAPRWGTGPTGFLS